MPSFTEVVEIVVARRSRGPRRMRPVALDPCAVEPCAVEPLLAPRQIRSAVAS
jgi:hypothetical protein